ncbi:MAG: hypothetical protein AAGJ80_05165 [Cyanobacteria bacterium J06553_1]
MEESIASRSISYAFILENARAVATRKVDFGRCSCISSSQSPFANSSATPSLNQNASSKIANISSV